MIIITIMILNQGLRRTDLLHLAFGYKRLSNIFQTIIQDFRNSGGNRLRLLRWHTLGLQTPHLQHRRCHPHRAKRMSQARKNTNKYKSWTSVNDMVPEPTYRRGRPVCRWTWRARRRSGWGERRKRGRSGGEDGEKRRRRRGPLTTTQQPCCRRPFPGWGSPRFLGKEDGKKKKKCRCRIGIFFGHAALQRHFRGASLNRCCQVGWAWGTSQIGRCALSDRRIKGAYKRGVFEKFYLSLFIHIRVRLDNLKKSNPKNDNRLL